MKFELEIDAFLDVHNGQDQPGVVLAIVKNGDLILLEKILKSLSSKLL